MPTGMHFRHAVVIDGADLAGITLAGASIDYGTRRPEETPTPANAYFTLVSADAVPNIADDYPGFSWGDRIPSGFTDAYVDDYEGGLPRINAGQSITVNAATPTGFTDAYVDDYAAGFDSTRFTGVITAIDVSPGTINITAVAPSEALSRVIIDPSGWPEESETDRVARIAAAAGIVIDVDGDSTATMAAPGPNAAAANALALLAAVRADTDGLLWSDRSGRILYRTRGAASGASVDLTPAATLLVGLTMTMELGAIANAVSVEYGPPGQRATVTATDDESIATYGRRDMRVSTGLALESDAAAKAARALAHYAAPSWHMPSATVNLRLAELQADFPAHLQELLSLDLDDTVTLPALLPGYPVESYTSRVLGYRETLDPYSWSLTFSLNPSGWTKP